MKYSEYQVEDFVMNESFQNWILKESKEDALFWNNWLLHNLHKAEEVEKAKDMLSNLSFEEKKVDTEIIKAEWISVINHPDIIPGSSKSKSLVHSKYMLRLVASLAILLMVSLGYYLYKQNNTTEYKTAFGETMKITLPDYSVVTLNSNSKISFPKTWKVDQPRIVMLKGEAYFSVTHKKNNQRFVVKTGDLDVIVLGTEFNVNNRRGNVKVALNSGKVKLTDARNNGLIMKPGELVTYSPNKEQYIKEVVAVKNYSSWKTNTLHFDNTSLNEIVTLLEDNYGFEVVVKDRAILTRRFTGNYPADNINILIQALSGVFHLNIYENGKQIVLENKK